MFGVRAHDLGKGSLNEIVRKIKSSNAPYIQLAFAKAISDIDCSTGNFNPGLAEYIRKAFEKENITISVLGCYINPANPVEHLLRNDINKFKEHIKYAKYLNAHMVGTETGTYTSDYSQDKTFTRTENCYQLFLKSMQELTEYAEKFGVIIGIEGVTCHTLYCAERINRFLQDIKSPNVHVIFDPVNLVDEDNFDEQNKIIDKAMELFSDKIIAIHLKDYIIENNEKKVVPIGEGIFDFEYLFHHLKSKKPFIHMLLEDSNAERFSKESELLTSIYNKA